MRQVHSASSGFRYTCVIAAMVALCAAKVGSAAVLTGMPSYEWYYGCSPTSAAMMVGYWDGLPGYGDLFYGDASVETQEVRDMIASPEHLVDPHAVSHPANCIADFMRTSLNGITAYEDIAPGLAAYVEWDNPTTPVNESYEADVVSHDLPMFGGQLSWDTFTGEIDAGRPMMLNVVTYYGGGLYGHSVVGYGYQEDMFEILGADGQTMVTLDGMAVRDTWSEGSLGSQWVGAGSPIDSIIDGDGVEWWPWLEPGVASSDNGLYDWMLYQGVTMNVVPEPTTLVLLLMGLAIGLVRRSHG